MAQVGLLEYPEHWPIKVTTAKEASGRPMIEKRRSRRTVSKIPLQVRVVDAHRIALTAAINRHGALILSPIPWAAGTQLEITNQRTGAITHGRVVWCGGEDAPGSF